MLINSILSFTQKIMSPFVQRSLILKNLDSLILANIILLIFATTVTNSDGLGIFAVFMMILTTIKLLTQRGEKFNLTNAEIFLLLYFITVLISVAGSTLLQLSVKGFLKTFVYFGFYVSFIHYLKDNFDKLKYIILAITLVAFGESIVAFKQNCLAVSEISGWQDMSRLNPEEVMTRVYGTLKPYNPNLFGGYMLAVLPSSLLWIYSSLRNRNYKFLIFALVLFFFSVATVIMTGCRGAYIGLFAQLILLTCIIYRFIKPQLKQIFIYLSSTLSLLMSLFILSKASLRARVISIFAMRSDSSNSFRFNVYNSCIEMFKDNWLLGIGVGNQNFREIYGLYMKTGFDALSAYNVYLEIAVESGIFALIFFSAFVFLNLIKAVKLIFKSPDERVIHLVIALISIVGLLMHGMVDTVFFRPQIQFIFWIMIGIIRVITSSWGNNDRIRN